MRGSRTSACRSGRGATTKKRVPPLRDYLIAADPAPERPEQKVAKMRSALSVLSAQYGIPLRTPAPPSEGAARGE